MKKRRARAGGPSWSGERRTARAVAEPSLQRGRRAVLQLGEEPLRLGDSFDLDRDRVDRLLDALQLLGHAALEHRSRPATLEPTSECAGDRPTDDDDGARDEESDRDVDGLAGDRRARHLRGLTREHHRARARPSLHTAELRLGGAQRLLRTSQCLIGGASLVAGPGIAKLLLRVAQLLLGVANLLLRVAYLLLLRLARLLEGFTSGLVHRVANGLAQPLSRLGGGNEDEGGMAKHHG